MGGGVGSSDDGVEEEDFLDESITEDILAGSGVH